jgi:hypothetical protein
VHSAKSQAHHELEALDATARALQTKMLLQAATLYSLLTTHQCFPGAAHLTTLVETYMQLIQVIEMLRANYLHKHCFKRRHRNAVISHVASQRIFSATSTSPSTKAFFSMHCLKYVHGQYTSWFLVLC